MVSQAMSNSKTDFTPWDQRYSADEPFYGSEPNDFLRSQTPRIVPGGKVLCLAEGYGRNALFLALGGLHITAVDGSQVGLSTLEKQATEKHLSVETVCADLADFDMGIEKWDAIVSIWCHLPQPLRAGVHARSVKALKHGGVFILEAYTPRQLQFKTGGPPVVEMLMTLEALRTELQGLEILHGVEIDRDIHEGRGHEGKSAVVQITARKN